MAEALTLGVPVIASDLPCHREVGQGIPALLDPHHVDAWVDQIAAFDDAAALRQRRIDALHGYCPPTWNEHFEQVDAWLAMLAGASAVVPAPGSPTTGRELRMRTQP
jgi:glycosyltransferase involved in cell wall biosynthesis